MYEDKFCVVKTPVEKFRRWSLAWLSTLMTHLSSFYIVAIAYPRESVTPTSVEHNASEGSVDVAVQGFAKQRNAFHYPREPVFLTLKESSEKLAVSFSQ